MLKVRFIMHLSKNRTPMILDKTNKIPIMISYSLTYTQLIKPYNLI